MRRWVRPAVIHLRPATLSIEIGFSLGQEPKHSSARLQRYGSGGCYSRVGHPSRRVRGLRGVGFAYGTLPEHGAIGEERFTVEWHAADDSVWFDLYAFSRPNKLVARLGYPFVRRLQRRFAQAAKRSMAAAVA